MPFDNIATITDLCVPDALNFDVIVESKAKLHQNSAIKYADNDYTVMDQWGNAFQNCSDKYKPILYKEPIEIVKEALILAGLEYEPCTMKWNWSASKGQMSLHITFPQILITPQVGDTVAFRVVIYNSYDGRAVLQQLVEAVRLICTNGMTRGDQRYNTRRKHTTNIDLSRESVKMQLGLDSFYESEARYQKWTRTPVLTSRVEGLFKKTLTKKEGGKFPYTVKTLDDLMLDWNRTSANMGRNVWSAYNVATAWASHAPTSSFIETKRRERNTKVASMLNSDHWLELEES